MMKFRQFYESQHLPSVKIITQLMPKILQVAQHEYDTWEQDENGYNDELGSGGICQDIAEAISNVLHAAGINCRTMDSNGMGEQHVWIVAKFQEGIYEVDISPSVYETGGGYNWKKIPGVKFDSHDVMIHRIGMSEEDFENDY